MSIEEMIQEYENKCPIYSQFILSVEMLLKSLLKQYHINVHSVTSRLKDKKSLMTKLSKPDRIYNSLADEHDICGLRVITYFNVDVDPVCTLINNEFFVDPKNSVDKTQFLSPDQFGYVSVHYIVKLSRSRLQLTEYRYFEDCVAEIQIRSILQHTWAEIEHDLGYKQDSELPTAIRRRFSRLSGLLELADDEFYNIRNQISDYRLYIEDKIKTDPAEVKIDQTSLLIYIKSSDLVHNVNKDIQAAVHVILEDCISEDMDMLLKRLRYLRLRTIADIDRELLKHRDLIVRFAVKLMAPTTIDRVGGYTTDISVFYLPYAIMSSTGSIDRIREFCHRFISKHDDDIAQFILNIQNISHLP